MVFSRISAWAKPLPSRYYCAVTVSIRSKLDAPDDTGDCCHVQRLPPHVARTVSSRCPLAHDLSVSGIGLCRIRRFGPCGQHVCGRFLFYRCGYRDRGAQLIHDASISHPPLINRGHRSLFLLSRWLSVPLLPQTLHDEHRTALEQENLRRRSPSPEAPSPPANHERLRPALLRRSIG